MQSIIRAAFLTVLAVAASPAVQPLRPIRPAIAYAARPLPLSAVRLTGGPLKHAQDLDHEYLLKLEPDRMLSYYRQRAGLKPKSPGYGGWDGDGRNLTGHILGHYLSAASMMYAATGDARLKDRIDYIVKQLKEVQDANHDGYLGALAGGKECFAAVARGEIRASSFDLNGLWSPFYTLHKLFAGLRDAYRYTGNREALDEEVKFAGWAEGVLAKLDEAQVQKMLNTEFGGMNEVLVDLYADTGDKRWLALSYRFEHHAVLDPLKDHEDHLGGQHVNMQIPKLLGSLARFTYVGDAGDGFAAGYFWDQVVQHHAFATGGVGKDEYFDPPDKLTDFIDGRTAETCNVYNMLKMTRVLFALRPDDHYAEYEERALFNHMLGSIDPQDGRVCYMVPVGRGVQHEYQDMFRDFTCCVGTGMESHALDEEGIYYESGDRLWVNLYAPSTAEWKTAGLNLTAETDFPEGESATVKLELKSPKPFALDLRRPAWAGDGFAVKVNGEAEKSLPQPGAFVELKRTWKSGDRVELVLPKTLRLEPLPDNPRRVAFLWGPLVLGGDLGSEGDFPAWKPGAIPVLVAADRPVADWLKPVPGQPGNFRTDGVGRDQDVNLVPFYRLHRRTYALYWDLYTLPEWEKIAADRATAAEHEHKLELATVGFVQPGIREQEASFHQQGEQTWPDRVMGRPGRRGRKWFSFDLPVDPAHATTLVVTYYSDEWRKRTFEILIDAQHLADQTVEKGGPPRFYDVEYPVPASLIRDKKTVTVRFQAANGTEIAAVYGIRTVRADEQK